MSGFWFDTEIEQLCFEIPNQNVFFFSFESNSDIETFVLDQTITSTFRYFYFTYLHIAILVKRACVRPQTSKVVLLEDLASHFGMRTQDAISRLQDLLASGSLTGQLSSLLLPRLPIPISPIYTPSLRPTTGVIDDRGKFISITPQELDSVAQFIRQRGRVSITELAQASNKLINLTPESRSTA